MNKYREKNGSYPERIFVYRDGVSDSQFDMLREVEIEPMKDAFKQCDTNYKYELLFLFFFVRFDLNSFLKP